MRSEQNARVHQRSFDFAAFVARKKKAEMQGTSAVNQTKGELRKQGRVQFSSCVLYGKRLSKSETISEQRNKMCLRRFFRGGQQGL